MSHPDFKQPEIEHNSESYYKMAYGLHYDNKDYEPAFVLYEKILTDFPDSKEAGYAKTQIENIKQHLPDIVVNEDFVEEVLSGDYYKRTKEWRYRDIVITSSFNVEGYSIKRYVDYLSYETVVGMGIIKGAASVVSDIVGMESESLRKKMIEAKEIIIDGIRKEAHNLGCNAVIGFNIRHTMFVDTMVAAIASGTGVVIEKNDNSNKQLLDALSKVLELEKCNENI
jgi:uncharacterized protein YbjQ (UPF0145 family)